MQEGVLVAVMYHYIRAKDPHRWSGIFPLSPEEFVEQLDALAQMGRIIHPSEAYSPSDEPVRILLTFDDGTTDHYHTAWPILRDRGLSGLFAVLSGPSTDGYVPTMHLVHLLVSTIGDQAIWQHLVDRMGEGRLGSASDAMQVYSREPSTVRQRVKYALNFALPSEQARDLLMGLFAEHVGDTQRFVRQWYLTNDQISQMATGGMEFAVHGHHHLPLTASATDYVDQEVVVCEQWLTDLTGVCPRAFVAPFGGTSHRGMRIEALEPSLRARGYRCAYLTQPGINQGLPFFVKRIDCADLPPRNQRVAFLTDP